MQITQHKRRKSEGRKYEFINEWYEGDLDVIKKYLIPHTTERPNDPGAINAFRVRKDRTSNDNELRPAIEVHLGHLAQVIDFGGLDKNERIAAIIKDATGFGVDEYELLDEVKELYMLHGFVGVLVEGANVPENETRAQAKAGERSYQLLFTALNIINWAVFKDGPRKGQFSEVVLQNDNVIFENKERMHFSRFVFPNGGASEAETFVREEWVSEAKDWKDGHVEVKQYRPAITSQLTVIPFVTIGRGIKDTRFYDVAQANKKLFNDKSVVDHTNYCQGFERVIVAGAKSDELKPLSEGQWLALPNSEISVHAIPAGQQEAMMLRVKDQEQRVRKYARFDADSLLADDSKEGQSSQSKAHDMAGRVGQYENILDKIDNALNRIFEFHCEYENVNAEVKIASARDFGLEDRTQKLSERNICYSHARELGAFETQKTIMKIEIDEALDISDEEKAALKIEIDGLEQQPMALPGEKNIFGGFAQ